MKKIFAKAKAAVRSNKKMLMSCAMMALMLVCMIVPASAAEVTPVSVTDFQSVLDALTAQISVATVVGVLAAAAAACVGLAFMWWGVRKLIRALMSAFKKGKVSL